MDYSTFFKDKTILVTGGTGTIGSEIVTQLLDMNPRTIRILSNSENELWQTRLRFKDETLRLRFLLGDIRDYERVLRAANNVDYIFNAAAVKHVPISEYNPMEAINVNIHGLENIIEAAFKCNVKKLIHISTDKAVNPTTVMGATKMLGERLCISRELTKGTYKTQISIVRFGNVLGSRGSIIPLIKEQIKTGKYVTLTDEKMKRFFLSISQAVGLVLDAAVLAKGGEIFVLKMPTIFIKDLIEILIKEFGPKIGKNPEDIQIKIIGPRLGEKINEVLISPVEFSSCYDLNGMYCIYPLAHFNHDNSKYKINNEGTKAILDKDFHYNTEYATTLSKKDIKDILKESRLI